MQLATRKVVDRAFTGLGLFSTFVIAAALVCLLGPIVVGGVRAFVFRGTVEFRIMQRELFARGDQTALDAERIQALAARRPVFDALAAFERELSQMKPADRRAYRQPLADFKAGLQDLLGPLPGQEQRLERNRYGATRWDRAQVKLKSVLYVEEWVQTDSTKMAERRHLPRVNQFKGTALEPAFAILERDIDDMLRPRWTFYWRFLTDRSVDAHVFGGIWAEVLGTLYLTLGAVLFAVPVGVISAIYLVEYANQGALVQFLRSCISTLAGVPSIVFGLFGLALFINTLKVSESKSVLAGALTLALLILPVVIRASEEALRSVPRSYKEASLSLGAGRWRTVLRVVLPAALPGILTGVIISMGRAAGETAPIIFTAAVAKGLPPDFWRAAAEALSGGSLAPLGEALSTSTPALPWNIYNIATEHKEVSELAHVQYGMVLTLVALVLLLNISAIVLRARISHRLSG